MGGVEFPEEGEQTLLQCPLLAVPLSPLATTILGLSRRWLGAFPAGRLAQRQRPYHPLMSVVQRTI